MNRALVTSLASLASLLALAALEGTASAQNFGVPPPPAQYSGTYTSTAAPPAYASTAQASARVGQSGSPAADFGNQYNLSIGSDFGFNFGVISQNSGPTTIDFTLLPAVDYFIIQNLSIGGTIGIDYSHTSQDVTDTTTVASHTLDFRIQPRVGYNIPVNQSFSVWPRVGLQFDHLDSGSATTVNNTTTSTGGAGNAFGVAISVPILWHPYEHYYLGLSPNLTAAFVGDGKYTSAGINFVVGGWL